MFSHTCAASSRSPRESSSSSSSSGGGGGGGGGVRLARGKSVLNEAPPSEGVDISDEASGGDGDSAERLLREHFEQLTASFLQPLEMFTSMGSLSLRAPPPAAAEPIGGSPGSRAPPGQAPGLMMMHEWSYETQMRFLKELERMEPPPLPRTIVPQRADLLRLYTAFLRTPHFAHWWERRRERAAAGLAPSATSLPPAAAASRGADPSERADAAGEAARARA